MAETRICPDCGHEWNDKVIFCMGCGARTVVKTKQIIISTPIEEKIEENAEKAEATKNVFGESKKLPETEKLPDIEDLILAYLRKVKKDKKSDDFIQRVREIVNQ